MLNFKNIINYLEFINISTDDQSIFEWKPPNSYKSYMLDLNIVKQNRMSNIFFHLNKGNLKIVHIRKDKLIYSAGATNELQFQLLEALIEYISKKFYEIWDVDYVLSYENFTPTVFNAFKDNVHEIIKNFHTLDLVKVIHVECMACEKLLPLIVKISLIKNAESYPVPIVFDHLGHSILCYIDKNFQVRGVELVNKTG
jgi:hypothetical protein